MNTTKPSGEIRLESTETDDAVASFLAQIAAHDAERQAATETGIPALFRLVEIANRDTGQAATVRRFMLGLYNSRRFPFSLTSLRGLDKALFDDAIAVLTLDARATKQEIHCYIDRGGELFERWARVEGGK